MSGTRGPVEGGPHGPVGGPAAADRLLPSHHDPAGGFRNPWPPLHERAGGVLRWRKERKEKVLAPDPTPEDLPRGQSRIARPRVGADELRITWVGHSTFLLQVDGWNLLTDPVWSRRASPFSWIGPRRFTPPGVDWDDLPPIDAVLLSHDHYDHLDTPTVRKLHRRFGQELRWIAPLGHADWLAHHGVECAHDLDWWEGLELAGLRVTCLPARHWTRRTPWDAGRRLWSSWAIRTSSGVSVYFGGDSGWFPEYGPIGREAGPFDAVLLPIGAYDPAWFMSPVHMSPEEAVDAWRELGGKGVFCGMHWGTFRLSDEDPLEPPRRVRAAWEAEGLDPEGLWIARHGETRIVRVRPPNRRRRTEEQIHGTLDENGGFKED